MIATTHAPPPAPAAPTLATRPAPLRRVVQGTFDCGSMINRNLLLVWRNPSLVILTTIQPILGVLLFRYVLGGAIYVPGYDYVQYLMPGIFVQTVVFGGLATVIGFASDIQRGFIERFRALPMARPAVLIGRTVADLGRTSATLFLMFVVGLLVGFKVIGNYGQVALALLLLFLLAFAMSWIYSYVALISPNPEAAQAASFPVLMILVFASSAFVPPETMPDWLRLWAEHQPVSITVDAVRALLLDRPVDGSAIGSAVWSIGIIVVFAYLSIKLYSNPKRAGR
jgi:ABC-2 type transport system permease protein/oleandomycin transport system permease protein